MKSGPGSLPGNSVELLFRIQLDNELFANIFWNVFAIWVVKEFPLKLVSIDFKPWSAPSRPFYRILDDKEMSTTWSNRDNVSGANLCRRNGDDVVVHHNMSVVHKLPGLPSCHRKTEAVDGVVQSGLKEFQEVLTGNSLLAGCFLK